MPNIAALLKAEITRLARKEVRAHTQEFKKASGQYRSQIAALKKSVQGLERQLRRVGRSSGRPAAAREEEEDGSDARLRFSAKGFAAQRKRLELSAAEYAKLLGVSAQSVYKWETGKARPRRSQLEAIAGIRGIGKKEAAARLGG